MAFRAAALGPSRGRTYEPAPGQRPRLAVALVDITVGRRRLRIGRGPLMHAPGRRPARPPAGPGLWLKKVLRGTSSPKPKVDVAVVRRPPVAVRRAAVRGVVVPGTATVRTVRPYPIAARAATTQRLLAGGQNTNKINNTQSTHAQFTPVAYGSKKTRVPPSAAAWVPGSRGSCVSTPLTILKGQDG